MIKYMPWPGPRATGSQGKNRNTGIADIGQPRASADLLHARGANFANALNPAVGFQRR
jgi:hypothetical protein